MRARQENRLGQLKDEMKQSLIDIKETKQRLQLERENKGRPDFKEQVLKFSQRIDKIIAQKQESDINRMKDRKLKWAFHKLRVRRIVKEQLRDDEADSSTGRSRFKEKLLHKMDKEID